MKSNNPVWADLSTYNPGNTIPFYEKIFGWKFYKEFDYYTAYLNFKPVAGLYETPGKFKQMRMPHFWMTYFQVNDLEKTIKIALESGGILEMKEEVPEFGKVALIRDPLGSGFTIYECSSLFNARNLNKPNTIVWNELHVSDSVKAKNFYEKIFNWSFKKNEFDVINIFNSEAEHIADIIEIPNDIKSKYEYWVITIQVNDLITTKNLILENGGSVVLDEGDRILCTDNSGEAFFYIQ